MYNAWVENVGDFSNPYANDLTNFTVICGNFIYAKVWDKNCMYIQDFDTGSYSGDQCYGPDASAYSAEAIAERPEVDGTTALLANFGQATFQGVGITDNGSYLGMNQVNHDYTNMWSSNNSYTLATVGSIFYDGNQNPPDDYSVTWQRYS